MKINHKLYIPRLGDRAGTPTSRSAILSGRVRSFYSPGQEPERNFRNPIDWIPAGFLLRMPQVCWLNHFLSEAIAGPTIVQTWRMYYPDDRYSPLIAFFDQGVPWYYGEGPFTTTQNNAEYDESVRLAAVFDEAKSRIEAIRPGRTWVYRWDWSSFDSSGWSSDGFLQFPAPSSIQEPYIGTNFLNVWAGHGLLDINGSRTVLNPYEPEPEPTDDPWFGRPQGRLESAYDNFFGYSVKLYDPTVGLIWTPPSPSPSDFDSDGKARAYFPYEVENPKTYGYASDLFDFFDEQLSDYGVEHSGATADLTADSVVQLISDHFGFDPSTGRDLV